MTGAPGPVPAWLDCYGSRGAQYARHVDPTLTVIAERLVGLAGARPGVRLLDLATGTGEVARAAVRAGAAVTGVDLSEGVLEVARAGSPEIEFVCADAAELPFPDGAFDAVTCGLAVSHFGDRGRVFREILRVLVPGGRFVASAWGRGGGTAAYTAVHEALDRAGAGEKGYTLDEATWMQVERGEEALRHGGFDRVRTHAQPFSGRFRSVDDALGWALAWPAAATRAAQLDAPRRASVLADARQRLARSHLSWTLVMNLYAGARPSGVSAA